MNTFSKSLAPSFRVAYVVLPKPLLKAFDQISSYHRCTVPSFEQYILTIKSNPSTEVALQTIEQLNEAIKPPESQKDDQKSEDLSC